ncbi:MAG: hypothetical protein M1561_06930 [Gammaproteobacteria bacterium]|nr:hypothetical protein [Gammaproteobacteria bacterium]
MKYIRLYINTASAEVKQDSSWLTGKSHACAWGEVIVELATGEHVDDMNAGLCGDPESHDVTSFTSESAILRHILIGSAILENMGFTSPNDHTYELTCETRAQEITKVEAVIKALKADSIKRDGFCLLLDTALERLRKVAEKEGKEEQVAKESKERVEKEQAEREKQLRERLEKEAKEKLEQELKKKEDEAKSELQKKDEEIQRLKKEKAEQEAERKKKQEEEKKLEEERQQELKKREQRIDQKVDRLLDALANAAVAKHGDPQVNVTVSPTISPVISPAFNISLPGSCAAPVSSALSPVGQKNSSDVSSRSLVEHKAIQEQKENQENERKLEEAKRQELEAKEKTRQDEVKKQPTVAPAAAVISSTASAAIASSTAAALSVAPVALPQQSGIAVMGNGNTIVLGSSGAISAQPSVLATSSASSPLPSPAITNVEPSSDKTALEIGANITTSAGGGGCTCKIGKSCLDWLSSCCAGLFCCKASCCAAPPHQTSIELKANDQNTLHPAPINPKMSP